MVIVDLLAEHLITGETEYAAQTIAEILVDSQFVFDREVDTAVVDSAGVLILGSVAAERRGECAADTFEQVGCHLIEHVEFQT